MADYTTKIDVGKDERAELFKISLTEFGIDPDGQRGGIWTFGYAGDCHTDIRVTREQAESIVASLQALLGNGGK